VTELERKKKGKVVTTLNLPLVSLCIPEEEWDEVEEVELEVWATSLCSQVVSLGYLTKSGQLKKKTTYEKRAGVRRAAGDGCKIHEGRGCIFVQNLHLWSQARPDSGGARNGRPARGA